MSSLSRFVVFSMAMLHLEHSIALTVCKFRGLQRAMMEQGGVAGTAFDGAGNNHRISRGVYRTSYVDCHMWEAHDPQSHS
mmetsp:Transcript_43739/g.84002  ORF Transcript_43739/g.84002 Transcript_43739/m.84002 type:complete len:80 (+) Transcript_43739:1301-1540(+)